MVMSGNCCRSRAAEWRFNMEILQIIDELEDVVDKSFSLFGFALTNKEDLLALVDEIRLKLPDELKQAKWVKEERQRILKEAEQESEKIIESTKEKVEMLIDDHEITRAAKSRAAEILQDAQNTEAEMRRNAVMYADGLLSRAENVSISLLSEVQESRKQLKK